MNTQRRQRAGERRRESTPEQGGGVQGACVRSPSAAAGARNSGAMWCVSPSGPNAFVHLALKQIRTHTAEGSEEAGGAVASMVPEAALFFSRLCSREQYGRQKLLVRFLAAFRLETPVFKPNPGMEAYDLACSRRSCAEVTEPERTQRLQKTQKPQSPSAKALNYTPSSRLPQHLPFCPKQNFCKQRTRRLQFPNPDAD